MPDDTDWNLVVQAQIAIKWIFESTTSKNSAVSAAVTNPFEASITCGDFAHFLQSFVKLAKCTYFRTEQERTNNAMQVDLVPRATDGWRSA